MSLKKWWSTIEKSLPTRNKKMKISKEGIALIKKFEGSLPLALAGYNAGPRRVEIWIKRYGNPLKNQISMIDWIESIPIYETRNYVKKVITNYRVYKSIFDVRDPESFNIVLNNLKTY